MKHLAGRCGPTGVGGAIRSAEMCVRAIVDGHAELKEIVIGLYVEGQIFIGDVVVAQSLAPRVKLTNDAVVVGICAGIVAGPELTLIMPKISILLSAVKVKHALPANSSDG